MPRSVADQEQKARRQAVIPSGWSLGRVGDHLEVIGGGTPSKAVDEFWASGTIDWYTPSDLTRARTRYVCASNLQITPRGLDKSSARLFPAASVLMTSRATLGVLAIARGPATCNQGFIVIPPTRGIPATFIYEWLASKSAELASIATGATFKEITKGAFKRFPFLCPPIELLARFDHATRPMGERIAVLEAINGRLAATRDLLLPRLVTGRLDISDVDLGNLLPPEGE